MFSPEAPSPFRVLLIEDNPGDAALIREFINEAGPAFAPPVTVARLEEAFRAVEEEHFDIVLLDLSLPDSNGFETFSAWHAQEPETPVIVLSGHDDEEMALRTVHAGAQDYLIKGRIQADGLGRTIRHAIERSRSDGELARERHILNSLLDHLPDCIFFKDTESRFTRVNQALLQLFRLQKAEEAIGKCDADFFSEDYARAAAADERLVIETGDAILGKMEPRLLPDGSTGWALTTRLPLRDHRGRIIGTTGIARDITELKKMEEALSAERNLLRSVIDNLPSPIYVKDSEGRYLLDNLAHQAFLGASSQRDVVGKSVFDFFPEELARRFHEDDMVIIRTGEPLINREELATDSSGKQRWLATTKVPIRNEAGKVSALVCIGRDITQRKLAQERLEEVNADLFVAVGRIKEAHEALQSTQLQLIEAEKLKTIGRLAAGVAHEVKNPLAIITMGLDYLGQQEYPPDSAVPMVLKDLGDAVKRADEVIRGMLDYSAPKTLALDAEDLNSVIEQALMFVRGEMDPNKHRVVKDLPPDLPRVKLDRMKMGQVFVNLFTNALHAMADGGTLTVRTYAKQLTGVGANIGDERSESFRVGQMVVVAEVEDTGHGVPPDKLSKLFDPFFTTKETGKGTGLGLSVTRSIVDLHGGTIGIKNREHGGAKVTVMLKA